MFRTDASQSRPPEPKNAPSSSVLTFPVTINEMDITMSFNKIAITLLLTLSATAALSEGNTDSYLCSADEATGFFFENGKWGSSTFNVQEEKFIIRPLNETEKDRYSDEYSHGYATLGNSFVTSGCSYAYGMFHCESLYEIRFSPDTGRYLKSHLVGYWTGEDNNENTPYLERGRCSKV